jgi:hypothetical protein
MRLNKSCHPQVECFQWNVPQILNNLLILKNSNKNHKLIRCNDYKVEHAKCHKFFKCLITGFSATIFFLVEYALKDLIFGKLKIFRLVFWCMVITLPIHFSSGVHHDALSHYTTNQN